MRRNKAKSSAILGSAALMAVAILSGCGKPAAPPPGAPQSATAPTLETGTESGPQESPAATPDSTSGAGSPQAEQGAPK